MSRRSKLHKAKAAAKSQAKLDRSLKRREDRRAAYLARQNGEGRDAAPRSDDNINNSSEAVASAVSTVADAPVQDVPVNNSRAEETTGIPVEVAIGTISEETVGTTVEATNESAAKAAIEPPVEETTPVSEEVARPVDRQAVEPVSSDGEVLAAESVSSSPSFPTSRESVREPLQEPADGIFSTLDSLAALIGPAAVWREKAVTAGMVRIIWRVGKFLQGRAEAARKNRGGQKEMAALAEGLQSAYGPRFAKARLYKAVKFTARVPEESLMGEWADSFSWSQILQLIRLGDPSQMKAVARRVREEKISARGLRLLVSETIGVPVKKRGDIFRGLADGRPGREADGGPGVPGLESSYRRMLELVLGHAVRPPAVRPAPPAGTTEGAGEADADGVIVGPAGPRPGILEASPLRVLSLETLRLHLIGRHQFEPVFPGGSESPGVVPAGADILLRRNGWGRLAAFNVVEGPYEEARLVGMRKTLGEIDLGLRSPGDKDPVGIVVFLGGERPRAELVCSNLLDLSRNMGNLDGNAVSYVCLGQRDELAGLVGRVYGDSMKCLRTIFGDAPPMIAGARIESARPDPVVAISPVNYVPVMDAGTDAPALDAGNDTPAMEAGNDVTVMDAGKDAPVTDTGKGVSVIDTANDTPVMPTSEDVPVKATKKSVPAKAKKKEVPVKAAKKSAPAKAAKKSPAPEAAKKAPPVKAPGKMAQPEAPKRDASVMTASKGAPAMTPDMEAAVGVAENKQPAVIQVKKEPVAPKKKAVSGQAKSKVGKTARR
ncbi:MAG: DUF1016 N-terminal domain-containing protein [Deltaproteobacteria bacterium]|jgi:hypothetical protein|nr:DUF1016 N-terminal domain-containing protein [Deltaproteobacteria bacterium]